MGIDFLNDCVSSIKNKIAVSKVFTRHLIMTVLD